MKILFFLFCFLVSFSAFAQLVKTEEGCWINHPKIYIENKIVPAPVATKSRWTGRCENGKAHGYGYYAFRESKNVENFIYLNAVNGTTQSGYAVLYVSEKESLFEAFVDLVNEKEIEFDVCRSKSACKAVLAEAEKNDGVPPEINLPPIPPAAPPLPPKAPESCTAKHPTQLVWQSPNKSTWAGGCINGAAHGYGWYKFDLTNDGHPSSRVEILLEYNKGEVANTYYYVKMFSQEQISFEGFAQLGGYQVDARNCQTIVECVRTADVLKNGVRPPVPPKAPQVPSQPPPHSQVQAPNIGHQETLDCLGKAIDDIGDVSNDLAGIKPLFVDWSITAEECLLYHNEKENGKNPQIAREISQGMSQFVQYYPIYAHYICQRNRVFVESCEREQLIKAINIFITLYWDRDVYEELKGLHGNYASLDEKCSNASSQGEFNNCWERQIQQLKDHIAQRHPKGTENGSIAFDGLARALAFLDAEGGSAYKVQYLSAYEHLMWMLFDTANTEY